MSLRIAVVGCGAIAERFHAPAIHRRRGDVTDLWLIDPVPARATALGQRVGGGRVASDISDIIGKVDAALLTLPHHLHHRVAATLLDAGIHVLSEKPLASSYAEAEDLVQRAARRGLVLAVNNTRRLYPSHRRVAEVIASGDIGRVTGIHFEEGDRFDWPLASPSLFGPRAGGKGILLDIGAHVVDLVCWWLGQSPTIVQYEDDAMGGTEATANLRVVAGDATATIRLSWLAKLGNGYRVEGTAGRIEGGIYDWTSCVVTRGTRTTRLSLPGPSAYDAFAHPLLDNFIDAVAGRAAPLISGQDVLASLALIDQCYGNRTRMPMPWFDAWQRIAS